MRCTFQLLKRSSAECVSTTEVCHGMTLHDGSSCIDELNRQMSAELVIWQLMQQVPCQSNDRSAGGLPSGASRGLAARLLRNMPLGASSEGGMFAWPQPPPLSLLLLCGCNGTSNHNK